MFAFITLSLIATLALAYIAARGVHNGSKSSASTFAVGMILPLVAIVVLGKSLGINDGSIASMMIAAIAITVAVTSAIIASRPKLVPIRVVAQRRRRPF